MESFGGFIKKHREQKGWSQTEFGAKVKINTPAVSQIENDRKKFPVGKLELLADVLTLDAQEVKDRFFADKFAKEAYQYKCSDSIFKVAESQSNYIKAQNTKQSTLKF
ncbi:MAG: helix-turn-helix transcriptional regulator [Bacteroidota bacterium]